MHLLQYVACFCWFSFTVFCVLGLAAQIYKPKRGSRKAENVEYVIVSAANREVREALFESIAHAKHARILVDEGSELIPELDGSSLVVVPSDYRSDLVGKGRAINYFIETEVQRGKWYAFIDDDNLVLDDNFLYEIPYYEERGYVAANPVLVPRNGRSSLAGVMDSIRHFDDLTTFRFFTGLLGKPLAGLHGELLAVKGEVLREIGYNNRSIVEDFRFAQELVRRGYRTWQSSTRVSIKSPNSLGGLLRQRGRWFRGILGDLKHCPPAMGAVVGVRMLLWSVGVFGSWALSPLWFMFWGHFWPAVPGGVCYWATYLYGAVRSGRLRFVPLIPLFGVLEAASAYAGLRQKGFEVIDKS